MPSRGTWQTSRRFEPTTASTRAARLFVVAEVEKQGWADLVDDVALCTAELASNAVLHTRAPFDVCVRGTAEGLWIEVSDSRGGDLPYVIAAIASDVANVIDAAPTGRGMRVVAELATRWGITPRRDGKTVWCAFGSEPDQADHAAVLPRADDSVAAGGAGVVLQLRGLPVRTAIASGLQVDGLVREMHLGLFDQSISVAEREGFYALLDDSAPARLAGRRAALAAAAQGKARFDSEMAITEEMIAAVSALSLLLAELPSKQPRTNAVPTSAVIELRAWLQEEVGRQLAGEAPRSCELPA